MVGQPASESAAPSDEDAVHIRARRHDLVATPFSAAFFAHWVDSLNRVTNAPANAPTHAALDDALTRRDPSAPAAVVRDRGTFVVAENCEELLRVNGSSALDAFEHMQRRGGLWIGAMTYQLGRQVERSQARRHPERDRPFADLVFARFGTTQRIAASIRTPQDGPAPDVSSAPSGLALGAMTSNMSERQHAASVAAIKEHLRDGSCYQINLTRRLTTPARVDAAALFMALSTHQPEPHAMLLDLNDFAIVSASPEQFLRVDGRHVVTGPIKGTAREAAALRTSRKDHAEHVMIVDLARNDLGRICEYASVTVPALATTETHPGLAHLVSRVHGTLRSDIGIRELVTATFPAASITGAPKPRVMDIIDELEPTQRDYYCGAIGWIDCDREQLDLAVAIRTFTMSEHGTDLGVGGGIVWDSEPAAEWNETRLKAERLLSIAGAYEVRTPRRQPSTPLLIEAVG